MSVKPIDTNVLLRKLAAAPEMSRQQPLNGRDFETRLRQAAQDVPAAKAAQFALAAQMHMMRTLASLNDENDGRLPSAGVNFSGMDSSALMRRFSLMSENRPALAPTASLLEAAPPANASDNLANASGAPVAEATAALPQVKTRLTGKPIDQLISRAADRFQLAPELVKAVIHAESSFNPRAVSPAGAQGLMQLMPGTAADMGVNDPFDAEQNVMGGARYLRWLMDRYDGDLDRALAAYNWGPGNLERRGSDNLPQETRTYLQRVKQYMADYS